MPFEGKVVLITGAGSGMGRLAARRLSAAGASVAGVDLNEEGLRATGEECERFRAWPLDVTDPRAVDASVTEVQSELGPIDRVMNAAAIMPTDLLLDQAKSQPKVLEGIPPIHPSRFSTPSNAISIARGSWSSRIGPRSSRTGCGVSFPA